MKQVENNAINEIPCQWFLTEEYEFSEEANLCLVCKQQFQPFLCFLGHQQDQTDSVLPSVSIQEQKSDCKEWWVLHPSLEDRAEQVEED